MIDGGPPYALHFDLGVFGSERLLDGSLYIQLLLADLLLIDQGVVTVTSQETRQEILWLILSHEEVTSQALEFFSKVQDTLLDKAGTNKSTFLCTILCYFM